MSYKPKRTRWYILRYRSAGIIHKYVNWVAWHIAGQAVKPVGTSGYRYSKHPLWLLNDVVAHFAIDQRRHSD